MQANLLGQRQARLGNEISRQKMVPLVRIELIPRGGACVGRCRDRNRPYRCRPHGAAISRPARTSARVCTSFLQPFLTRGCMLPLENKYWPRGDSRDARSRPDPVISLSEHFAQNRQRSRQCSGVHRSQPSHQPRFVERPDLFEKNQAILAGELDGNAKSCRSTAGRHRGDDRYIEKIVDLRWRNDHAGTSLADFPAAGAIELR